MILSEMSPPPKQHLSVAPTTEGFQVSDVARKTVMCISDKKVPSNDDRAAFVKALVFSFCFANYSSNS